MSYATHCIPWDEACSICNPGSGSEPPANPDDMVPLPVDAQYPVRATVEDLPALPWESPPVGPLQALREAMEKLGEYPEQDSEEYAAFHRAGLALESVEEQLAALQRERDMLIDSLGRRGERLARMDSAIVRVRDGMSRVSTKDADDEYDGGYFWRVEREAMTALLATLPPSTTRASLAGGSSPSSPKGDA